MMVKGKKIKEVFAGEIYVTTNKDIIITTLLGSCVAVCLMDEFNSVYGLNHFMLPMTEVKRRGASKIGKYGVDAMELLLKRMIAKGANKSYLKAKIFGGGQVINTRYNNVAQKNIQFAQNYLKKVGIEIIAQDIGGNCGRKIYFSPSESVYLKRIKESIN